MFRVRENKRSREELRPFYKIVLNLSHSLIKEFLTLDFVVVMVMLSGCPAECKGRECIFLS